MWPERVPGDPGRCHPIAVPNPSRGGGPQPDDACCLIPCAIDQDPYFRVTRTWRTRSRPSRTRCGVNRRSSIQFFPPLQAV